MHDHKDTAKMVPSDNSPAGSHTHNEFLDKFEHMELGYGEDPHHNHHSAKPDDGPQVYESVSFSS